MWEKDRELILAYRECFTNLHQSLKDGEEVDLKSACVDETQALLKYTLATIARYKDKHPQEVKDKH